MVTTVFVIASVVLVLLVLGYVLQPIWRARPAAGIGAIVLIGISVGLLYTVVGTPRALDPAQRAIPETLADAITQLQAELDRDPNQVEGWRLLARAYLAQGDMTEAGDAFGRALKLAPDDPDILTEAAEARALASDERSFDQQAVSMLQRALSLQPNHQRARWFLGISQRQAGDAAGAVNTWTPLLTQVDPATAATLRPQINQARVDAGLDPLPEVAVADASAVRITISVSLDPALAMQYPQGASVFVIARQASGAPMPVAVEKLQATQFPFTIVLDDNDSLMPTMKLSQLDQVQLSARISASGDASAQPGDFESASVTIDTGPEAAAALLIDQVVK
ncbi:tetratricopeptide repeat protein [Lysobacter sp. A378]